MPTNFESDINKGKIREFIFKNAFLGFLGIAHKDVSNDKKYQLTYIDLLTSDFTIDVKSLTFKDSIIIEEYTNYNEKLGAISKGWFYKSNANIIAFVYFDSTKDVTSNGMIIILRFDLVFKNWYEEHKTKYNLRLNKISQSKNGRSWQSAYRILPFNDLGSFISYYK